MRNRKLFAITLAAGGILVGGASVSSADPDLPRVPAHRHILVTASGEQVEIGPNACDDPKLQAAFNQFHWQVHRAGLLRTDPLAPPASAWSAPQNPNALSIAPC